MGDRNSLDFRVTYHGGSVSEPQNEAWRTEVVGDQGAPDAEYAVRGWSFATGSACQEGRLLVRIMCGGLSTSSAFFWRSFASFAVIIQQQQ